ncbi:MAG: PhzF family phenazine biosynthesis protein [Alphaproteobacteria bacterium]|nr:PhzF family phenazine biosynthesis protein [Alphaproteobacteria bacterium]
MKRREMLTGMAATAMAGALPARAQTSAGAPRKTHDFIQVDVFTHTPLEGNPLAVFPAADGMSDTLMQNIARELNHSETTFIQSARNGGDARVRIFSQTAELPFAGHPTLGTAFIMAQTRPGKTKLVLEENVGPISVALEKRADGLFVEMTQKEPVFGEKADPKVLAEVMGFSVDEIDSRYAPQMVSTGSNFLIVPLKSVSTLAKLTLGHTFPEAFRTRFSGSGYYVVTGEAEIESRMMGASSEDPATGSAVGCAAAFLVQNGIRKPDERVLVRQGRFVGRPSQLYVTAGMANGKATNVRVGGFVVEAMRGSFSA